jgi:hypothetical protein
MDSSVDELAAGAPGLCTPRPNPLPAGPGWCHHAYVSGCGWRKVIRRPPQRSPVAAPHLRRAVPRAADGLGAAAGAGRSWRRRLGPCDTWRQRVAGVCAADDLGGGRVPVGVCGQRQGSSRGPRVIMQVARDVFRPSAGRLVPTPQDSVVADGSQPCAVVTCKRRAARSCRSNALQLATRQHNATTACATPSIAPAAKPEAGRQAGCRAPDAPTGARHGPS